MPVITPVGPVGHAVAPAPAAFAPPFLPGPVVVSKYRLSENIQGLIDELIKDGRIKVEQTPSAQDDKAEATPPVKEGSGGKPGEVTYKVTNSIIAGLQDAIGDLFERRRIKAEATPPAEEASGDKKLEKKSPGYPNHPGQPSLPTSGDGSEFIPGPRLGQDEDAAAWPFGEGKDDIDPKWGRTRDKLKKKKDTCPWV